MIHKALDSFREGVADFFMRLPELQVKNDAIVVLSPLVKFTSISPNRPWSSRGMTALTRLSKQMSTPAYQVN